MDPTAIVTIAVAFITLAGTIATAIYGAKNKKKDRVELFFERYDVDRERTDKEVSELRAEVEGYRVESAEAKERHAEIETKLDVALAENADKDDRIQKLERKVAQGKVQYANLLRRFNNQKKKTDDQAKSPK